MNSMATSTNMAPSTDMAANSLYILINDATFQEPQYEPAPQVNGYYFLYNFSVYSNDHNSFPPLLHPDYVPYEDKIPNSQF